MGDDKKTLAPFLLKCYDMVDDPSTDRIISWGSFNTSFIIWDIMALEQELLPKYYKHRNISSFIRQLNIYGFKKYDPDRWEFTNEGFVKGQKHILKNIMRRKSSQGNSQQDELQDTSTRRKSSQGNCPQNQSQENNTSTRRKSSQVNSQRNKSLENKTSTRWKSSQGNNQHNQSEENRTSAGACVEVGELGLWEDVEILKKDKNVVMQELAILTHHQQGADVKLHSLGQRLQGMEISQQQMLSFLAMVVQSPGVLGQLLQQNGSKWRISETSKKRPYLALEQGTECNDLVPGDGQIVRYQPLENETQKPLLMTALNCDESQQTDPSANGLDNFFSNIDLMPSGDGMPVTEEQNGHLVPCDGQIVRYQPLENETRKPLLMPALNWDEYQQTDPSANGLDDFFSNIDLMPSRDGMPVTTEENGHSENEGQIVIPDVFEDGMMEKLLQASALLEDIETTEPNSTWNVGNSLDLDFTNNYDSLGQPSHTLDRLTEELVHLVSETNNEDGKS